MKFLVVIKTDKDDLIKREITAKVIDSKEVNFLCGKETLKEWKTVLDFEDSKLGFKGKKEGPEPYEKDKEINLIKGSHLLVKLELVGK